MQTYGKNEMVMWNPDTRKYERVFAVYDQDQKNIFTGKIEKVQMAITESGHRSTQTHSVYSREYAYNCLEKQGDEIQNFFTD